MGDEERRYTMAEIMAAWHRAHEICDGATDIHTRAFEIALQGRYFVKCIGNSYFSGVYDRTVEPKGLWWTAKCTNEETAERICRLLNEAEERE